MDEEILKKEGRIVGKLFREVFYVDYWVDKDLDNLLVEWQVMEENDEKSIPILLFFLLASRKRDVVKQLYIERYHEQRILPEWDCVPMYKELELFIENESRFFDERIEEPLNSLFDPDWRDIVRDDVCYCDFEMVPVTRVLDGDV